MRKSKTKLKYTYKEDSWMSSLSRVSECDRQAWAFSLWPRHVLAWQRTGAVFHPSHWVYHSLHYLSRANQKRVREFLESGTHKNTLPARFNSYGSFYGLIWVAGSSKEAARPLHSAWLFYYSYYLLYQLCDSESKLAAPTWPPCEAMSTGVLSGRDGWASAWAAQRH